MTRKTTFALATALVAAASAFVFIGARRGDDTSALPPSSLALSVPHASSRLIRLMLPSVMPPALSRLRRPSWTRGSGPYWCSILVVKDASYGGVSQSHSDGAVRKDSARRKEPRRSARLHGVR